MNKEALLEAVTQAYIDAKLISKIPSTKRTASEDKTYRDAVSKVRNNLKDFVRLFLDEELTRLSVSDFRELKEEWDVLQNKSVMPPKMSEINIDLATCQVLFKKIYMGDSTIQGMLETYDPMLVEFEQVLDRAKALAKGMSFSENEWEAESFATLTIPREVQRQYTFLLKIVSLLKRRDKAFEKAFMLVSRYYTTLENDPGELNREPGAYKAKSSKPIANDEEEAIEKRKIAKSNKSKLTNALPATKGRSFSERYGKK